MTSTIKRRPRGYRTGISSEVFEFVMKLLRDTLGTTGRYLDLMRSNAPLRIQSPLYDWVDFRSSLLTNRGSGPSSYMPRQFYRFTNSSPLPYASAKRPRSQVHNVEWRHHVDSHANPGHALMVHEALGISTWAGPLVYGSSVPYRHTYNASRII